jgi:hypothetical protein
MMNYLNNGRSILRAMLLAKHRRDNDETFFTIY